MKLLSLNIEGHCHLDRWIPWVLRERPDILCLQEVLKCDMEEIRSRIGMNGVYVANAQVPAGRFQSPKDDQWGIALFSRNVLPRLQTRQYWGASTEQWSNEKETLARHLILGDFAIGNKSVSIATTHFVWSPAGRYTECQAQALRSMLSYIPHEYSIVVGDFNFPRGGPLYSRLPPTFTNAIADVYTSSLDPVYHSTQGQVATVVDHLFYSNGLRCVESRFDFGISDHAGIVATIELDSVYNSIPSIPTPQNLASHYAQVSAT